MTLSRCNNPWYSLVGLDAFSGTPARCVADPPGDATPWSCGEGWSCGGDGAHIECATRLDGLACQWGQFFHHHKPYERLTGVSSGTPIRLPCPGWLTKDGTDACEVLGCYNATNSTCGDQSGAPSSRVQSGWLFSVFVDEDGRVDFSENKMHPSQSFEAVLAWAASVVLVIICCCLGACWVARRAQRALSLAKRRESRLSIELAASRRKTAGGASGTHPVDDGEEEPLREKGITVAVAVAVAIEEDIAAAAAAADEEAGARSDAPGPSSARGDDSGGGEAVAFVALAPTPAKRVSFAAVDYFLCRGGP